MTIELIKEDIKALRGASVTIFGQPTVLSSEEHSEDTIDILDVLEQLKDSELTDFTISTYNEDEEEDEEEVLDSAEEFMEHMEENGVWVEESHDNSYNWSSPVSHDFDFKSYKCLSTGYFYVALRVHRYGDVRGNYSEYALLKYDFAEGFLYDIMECNKTITVGDYDVNVDILSDSMEVYNEEGNYVKSIYDIEDFIKEVEGGLVELEN